MRYYKLKPTIDGIVYYLRTEGHGWETMVSYDPQWKPINDATVEAKIMTSLMLNDGEVTELSAGEMMLE